jgi:hypothetical protein
MYGPNDQIRVSPLRLEHDHEYYIEIIMMLRHFYDNDYGMIVDFFAKYNLSFHIAWTHDAFTKRYNS